jgi:hypothetical protein
VPTKVNLPPGCYGFDAKDGTRYNANRPGGHVTVDDRHARAINQGQYGQQDFISAKGAQSFGTKAGQLCESCGRTWNAWNSVCPKCDIPTVRI